MFIKDAPAFFNWHNKQNARLCRHSLTVTKLAQETIGFADSLTLRIGGEEHAGPGKHVYASLLDEVEWLGSVAMSIDRLIFVPILTLHQLHDWPNKLCVFAALKQLDRFKELSILMLYDLVTQVRRQLLLKLFLVLIAKVSDIIVQQELINIVKKLQVHFCCFSVVVQLFEFVLEWVLVLRLRCDVWSNRAD